MTPTTENTTDTKAAERLLNWLHNNTLYEFVEFTTNRPGWFSRRIYSIKYQYRTKAMQIEIRFPGLEALLDRALTDFHRIADAAEKAAAAASPPKPRPVLISKPIAEEFEMQKQLIIFPLVIPAASRPDVATRQFSVLVPAGKAVRFDDGTVVVSAGEVPLPDLDNAERALKLKVEVGSTFSTKLVETDASGNSGAATSPEFTADDTFAPVPAAVLPSTKEGEEFVEVSE